MSAEVAISLDQSCDVAIQLSVRGMAVSDSAAGSGYDCDAIVASITRYYKLLSKMVSIRPDDIAYPPLRLGRRRPDSKIPLEKLRRLGFNDRMIDFVRHVPFVLNGVVPVFPYTETIAYYHSVFDQYRDEEYRLEDPALANMWPIPDVKISEGVLPLSRGGECPSSGTWWMLDTNNGELTPHGPFDTWPHDPRRPREAPEDEEWRSSPPVPATAYFDGLCEKLKSLQLIPLPGDPRSEYWDMWEAPDEHEERFAGNPSQAVKMEAKQIYRQCHWPDLRCFQRAKCRRLLIDLRKREWDKQFPPSPRPPIQEPENDRRAPWGVENIGLQTNQEGGFVNTTFDI